MDPFRENTTRTISVSLSIPGERERLDFLSKISHREVDMPVGGVRVDFQIESPSNAAQSALALFPVLSTYHVYAEFLDNSQGRSAIARLMRGLGIA